MVDCRHIQLFMGGTGHSYLARNLKFSYHDQLVAPLCTSGSSLFYYLHLFNLAVESIVWKNNNKKIPLQQCDIQIHRPKAENVGKVRKL